MIQTITITTLILTTSTSFLVGVLVGWIASNHKDINQDTKLKTMVAVVITLGWASGTVAGIFIASYTVSPLLHALMGAIVGYFFTEDGVDFNIGGN